jgi:Tfp pilus assembly protein PilX
MHNSNKTQKGFTILVAVVTAGILLIIAMSIGGIAIKEQMLSTVNKESQIAFYAADNGIECASFWDKGQNSSPQNIFGAEPSSCPTNSNPLKNRPGTGAPSGTCQTLPAGTCNGSALSFTQHDDTHVASNVGDQATYSYTFEVSGIPTYNGSTCSIVKITKNTNDPSLCVGLSGMAYTSCMAKIYTTLDSQGYNTCDASLSRLGRGIIVTY